MTTTIAPEPVRRKGLLAFLDDSVTHFPHDADACKKKVALPLRQQQHQRRRRQQQKDDEEEETPQQQKYQSTAATLSEQLAMQKPRVVVLFFCNPEQTYSIQVRNRILQVLYNFSQCSFIVVF